jgi:hypothetical protein
VHANLGSFLQNFSLHPTKRNYILLNPYLTHSLSKLLKTVHLLLSATDHQKPHRSTEHCQQHHFTMNFKTNNYVSDDKNATEQQKIDSSAPKMIEPLTIVPPTKPKKKTTSKSTSRKKNTGKKGESKVAMPMSDLC